MLVGINTENNKLLNVKPFYAPDTTKSKTEYLKFHENLQSLLVITIAGRRTIIRISILVEKIFPCREIKREYF